MSITLYHASVPPLVRALTNLKAILGKAAAYAEARKIDPAVLVAARLYPDMYPLSRQVQIATDMAKGGACRLAGREIPKFEDTETTFDELSARLDKTIALLRTFKPEEIEGAELKTITLTLHNNTLTFQAQGYLLGYVLPNVYFHVATAYAILRHNGVEIGKKDFIGGIDMADLC